MANLQTTPDHPDHLSTMLMQDRLWRWFCDAGLDLWMLIQDGTLCKADPLQWCLIRHFPPNTPDQENLWVLTFVGNKYWELSGTTSNYQQLWSHINKENYWSWDMVLLINNYQQLFIMIFIIQSPFPASTSASISGPPWEWTPSLRSLRGYNGWYVKMGIYNGKQRYIHIYIYIHTCILHMCIYIYICLSLSLSIYIYKYVCV